MKIKRILALTILLAVSLLFIAVACEQKPQSNAGTESSGQQGSDEQGGQGSDEQGGQGSDEQGGQGSDEQGGQGSDEQGGQGSDEQGGQGSEEQGGQGSEEQGGQGSEEQGGQGSDEQGGQDQENVLGTFQGIGDIESVYALGAVTTAKLLYVSEQEKAQSAAVSLQTLDNGAAGKAQTEAEDFNKYFNMLDSFLDKSQISTEISENTATDAPFSSYKYRAVITGRNVAGAAVVHTLYYSEDLISSNEWDERDDGDFKHFSVSRYTVSGVIAMGDAQDTYCYMKGTRTLTTETEDGETERTETLVMRTALTEETYRDYIELSVRRETEEEAWESETEDEYIYRIYRDGNLVEKTEVEFETEEEHGAVETEYSIKFLSGASRGYYEIERETRGGNTYISVEYIIDGEQGKFTVVKNADGTYRYIYSSGDEKTFRDYCD